jgi:hypothetical protein
LPVGNRLQHLPPPIGSWIFAHRVSLN